MSDRKFYKTVITLEILSEEPIGQPSLSRIAEECEEGDWSGMVKQSVVSTLSGEEAAKALEDHGSDPSFFCLDADGNDLE